MPGPVMVVSHARNMAACKHPWFTMVRIAFFPFTGGNPVIKSIATCWNGWALVSVGMWYGGVLVQWVMILFC